MWHANAQQLQELENILQATLSRDSNSRAAASDALVQARLSPDFENYLSELLVNDGSKSEIRAAAGLQLKNSIAKDPAPPRQHVKDVIFRGLASPEPLVRNITGNVITQLFSAQGVDTWPEALVQLLAAAENGHGPEKEAAVSALGKICEDSSAAMDRDFGGERPLDHIASRLLSVARHGPARVQELVVACLNHLVPLKSQSMIVQLDEYLQVLFLLAGEEDRGVRKQVCSAFLAIRESHPEKLVVHLEGVLGYCVQSVELPADDEAVALEAAEFLLAVAESADAAEARVLSHALPSLVPVLLRHMVYSEESVLLMEVLDSAGDAATADRPEDVRPNMVRTKDAHNQAKSGGNDSDSDSDAEDELESWNLRRCCAATLDALSLAFPQHVIDVALPILQQTIVSVEWVEREAAILAFGAVSKSCMDHARDKLPALVPFLVERMADAQPRVRQITCWTLSRYSEWVAAEAHDGGEYSSYFQPTFEAMVGLTLDRHKIVQEAACSALSSFVENTEPALLEYYVGPLLEQFARCFAVYQRKNLLMLYDCVSTFVERIGAEIFGRRAEYADTLLPPLVKNWQSLEDDDDDLWPLLECMASVAAAMGEAFAPYAVPVFQRAVKILRHTVQMNELVHTDPLIEAPEKAFMVTTLDLVSGLIQGFQTHSPELLDHEPDFMPLVVTCLEDHDPDVRQSAYALLGDLVIFAYAAYVQPHVSRVVQCMGNEIHNCSYTTYPAVNNAVWSLGEMAALGSSDLAPFLPNLVALLVPVLTSDVESMLLQNTAICLGRMGLAVPDDLVLARRLPEFIFSWCSQMDYVAEDGEKDSAFLGMTRTISMSPDDGMGGLASSQGRQNLARFVTCIAKYRSPSEDLKEAFFQLISSYRALLGPAWGSVLEMVEERGVIETY